MKKTSSLFNAFGAVIKRDLLLAYRFRAELINPLAFFVMVITLFPLALGAEIALLKRIAPAIIWVGVGLLQV